MALMRAPDCRDRGMVAGGGQPVQDLGTNCAALRPSIGSFSSAETSTGGYTTLGVAVAVADADAVPPHNARTCASVHDELHITTAAHRPHAPYTRASAR